MCLFLSGKKHETCFFLFRGENAHLRLLLPACDEANDWPVSQLYLGLCQLRSASTLTELLQVRAIVNSDLLQLRAAIKLTGLVQLKAVSN